VELAGNRAKILADKGMANRARVNCIWGMEEEEEVVVVVVAAMGEVVEAVMRGAVDKVAGGRFTSQNIKQDLDIVILARLSRKSGPLLSGMLRAVSSIK